MRDAEGQPADLIVLQPITWSLHLDQPVAALRGPELHQVGQPAGVRADVAQYALETHFQVLCRQAVQGPAQQRLADHPPEYEWRLDAALVLEITANRVLVGFAF